MVNKPEPLKRKMIDLFYEGMTEHELLRIARKCIREYNDISLNQYKLVKNEKRK